MLRMPDRVLSAASVLLVTIWAGSIWSIGYLVAPTLFATLSDRVLAGTIAGLFWFDRNHPSRRTLLRFVAAMLICVLVGYVGLQPLMAALREAAGPGGVMDGPSRTQFGILHGVSSLIYLVQSGLAVALVFKSR